MQHVALPWPSINLYPLQWKHGILPTGPPKEVSRLASWICFSSLWTSFSSLYFFVPMPYLCPQLTQTHDDLTGLSVFNFSLQLTELFYTSQLEVSQSKNLIVQRLLCYDILKTDGWLMDLLLLGPRLNPDLIKCVCVCVCLGIITSGKSEPQTPSFKKMVGRSFPYEGWQAWWLANVVKKKAHKFVVMIKWDETCRGPSSELGYRPNAQKMVAIITWLLSLWL